MPNQERGEVDFQYQDKGITLKYDMNAFCELEELLQKPIHEILQDFTGGDSMGFREVRKFFLAGLPAGLLNGLPMEEKLSTVGNMIDNIGGVTKAQQIIVKAISLAFPEKEEGPEKKLEADAGSGAS